MLGCFKSCELCEALNFKVWKLPTWKFQLSSLNQIHSSGWAQQVWNWTEFNGRTVVYFRMSCLTEHNQRCRRIMLLARSAWLAYFNLLLLPGISLFTEHHPEITALLNLNDILLFSSSTLFCVFCWTMGRVSFKAGRIKKIIFELLLPRAKLFSWMFEHSNLDIVTSQTCSWCRRHERRFALRISHRALAD